jgi:hypothetical protein
MPISAQSRPTRSFFHYTSEAGLRGIVESNSLRATYFSDLNDASEIRQLRESRPSRWQAVQHLSLNAYDDGSVGSASQMAFPPKRAILPAFNHRLDWSHVPWRRVNTIMCLNAT